METTNYNPKEYEAYKERLKNLIDIIKESNELNYNTEIRLYLLLCETYYHTK